MGPVALGSLASLAAGLVTGIGAVPILFGNTVSRRLNDALLGFAAGVMLAASFFSLIMPGIDAARVLYGSAEAAAAVAVGGVVLGAACIAGINELVPHEHFVQGREGPAPADSLERIWLFVLAITIHNLPEGLAVGVGFSGGDVSGGTALATGIGLQNAPEGLAVAMGLLSCGYSRADSFLVATLTGLVEPMTGFLGAYAVSLSQALLPWGMTFAAGAMIYVISHEIIPETHQHGFQDEATAGLTAGLVIMMFLDVALGST
jgi:ZIP family zinc transporter